LFVFGLAGCIGARDIEARPAVQASVDDFAWFVGTWVTAEDPVTEEVWMPPAAGTMMGVNRNMSDGVTLGYEYLRLRERDGGIDYVASPGGQGETAFQLVELAEQRAVFENLAHDFPQRLTYTRVGDALTADVEGGGEGFSVAWQAVTFDPAEVEAEVRKTLETYRVAMSTGDYEAALRSSLDTPAFYWAEDGRKSYQSLAQVRVAFDQLKNMGGMDVAYTNTEVTVLSADHAIVYTQHATTIREAGYTFSGALTATLERTDDGFKFVAGHTSSAEQPRGEE